MEDSKHYNYGSQVDVILRSADGHNFKFHKCLLSVASPVFDTMFTLPQPSPSSSSFDRDDTKDGLPVVKLTEKKRVLQRLLGMYHPKYLEKDGKITSVDEWKGVFSAAYKYEMNDVVERLSWDLESLAETEPVRVFALATHHGMPAIARIAAMNTLKMPFGYWHSCPELGYITGIDLQRLSYYHTECGVSASNVVRTWPIDHKDYVWFKCKTCVGWSKLGTLEGKYSSTMPWWWKFAEDLAALVEKKPRGVIEQEFRVELEELAKCGSCKSKALVDMERFKHDLVAQIDEEISKVVLKTRF